MHHYIGVYLCRDFCADSSYSESMDKFKYDSNGNLQFAQRRGNSFHTQTGLVTNQNTIGVLFVPTTTAKVFVTHFVMSSDATAARGSLISAPGDAASTTLFGPFGTFQNMTRVFDYSGNPVDIGATGASLGFQTSENTTSSFIIHVSGYWVE